MGGTPCKAKIILNGATIQNELNEICYYIQESKDFVEFSDDAGYKMVEHLNEAEDLIFKFKRLFLESQNFSGPWPHALKW